MAETQEGLFYYRLKIPTFWPQAGAAAALAYRACLVTALAPAPASCSAFMGAEGSVGSSPSDFSFPVAND